ncbi:hypothetical protein EV217_4700 [Phyllobacterium myrsinacearum]|uniref:hypothetical protein n=1 Tax=Phyllobacterium myrsinacearum TaxID=28101 RepID=UPI00102A2D38|nr:hypothetical protein [Phyllobacterium myrsinacearum]RZS77339.1 hypothetical protein EV217_4700 [Phyllobacterium myrsinacearum]
MFKGRGTAAYRIFPISKSLPLKTYFCPAVQGQNWRYRAVRKGKGDNHPHRLAGHRAMRTDLTAKCRKRFANQISISGKIIETDAVKRAGAAILDQKMARIGPMVHIVHNFFDVFVKFACRANSPKMLLYPEFNPI